MRNQIKNTEKNNKTSCSGEKSVEDGKRAGTGLQWSRNNETKVET